MGTRLGKDGKPRCEHMPADGTLIQGGDEEGEECLNKAKRKRTGGEAKQPEGRSSQKKKSQTMALRKRILVVEKMVVLEVQGQQNQLLLLKCQQWQLASNGNLPAMAPCLKRHSTSTAAESFWKKKVRPPAFSGTSKGLKKGTFGTFGLWNFWNFLFLDIVFLYKSKSSKSSESSKKSLVTFFNPAQKNLQPFF